MTTKIYKIMFENGLNKIVIGDNELVDAVFTAATNFTVKELNTNAYVIRENN